MTEVRERWVHVDGIATRYLEAGSTDAPTMLLLHGGEFGSYALAEDWLPVIPSFGERFHVIAPDLLGCGSTDNPTPERYLFSAVARHAQRTVEALDLVDVFVMGHSRGGFVATLLALDAPERIVSLGVVGGGTLVTPPNPIYREWAVQAQRIDDLGDRVRYLVGENSYSYSHLDDDYVRAMSRAIGSEKSKNAQRHFTGAVLEGFHAELADLARATRDRVANGELTVPTLVMWGYDDPSAPIDVAGAATMNLFLGHPTIASMHIINAAGHYCFRERPDEFAAVTLAFVDGVR